jgi:comEA protein
MRSRIVRSLAATGLAALLLVSSAVALSADSQSTGSTPQTRLVGVVNINTAHNEALELLPGIGPARARAIIEYRKVSGPFKHVEDLIQVSGIGERALERIRPHCVLTGKTTAQLKR